MISFESLGTVSYSHSMAISLAVLTQYSNVTDSSQALHDSQSHACRFAWLQSCSKNQRNKVEYKCELWKIFYRLYFWCTVESLHYLRKLSFWMCSLPTGGWSVDEHDMFLYVTESYTNDLSNRRLLYIDCLQRCLPHKTRSHIVSFFLLQGMFELCCFTLSNVLI